MDASSSATGSLSLQTPTNEATRPSLHLPVLPIAVVSACIVLVALLSAFYVLNRRRSLVRIGDNQRRLCLESQPLESEAEPAEGRTFSRLTFTAPYVLPRSRASLSTAAPSTVLGMQYPTDGR
ncbi:hypothetical protein FB45DRAFT_1039457 [Roridomyces roridus]|uniref:Uncharacterized protein n=1 Tax=Roridomyces roridus TaxID=1738132 RepID=A0AAD7B3G7_9AGAR|nr:hypothetical protein FB45DRAFT_1039457 [Roridomyces roridus]